jgi:tryptophan synthase beta chain
VGHAVWLKREDLLHTGAHKINNALGQALLAKRMGKPRIIAETGAGQHGVATATACALLGLDCPVYMGTEDMRRQKPNVQRMLLNGTARRRGRRGGAHPSREAVVGGHPHWVTNVATTHYILGSAVGRHPSRRSCATCSASSATRRGPRFLEACGRLPRRVVDVRRPEDANAIVTIVPLRDDDAVRLIGVEAAGEGLATAVNGAPRSRQAGAAGSCTAPTRRSSGEEGQITEAHSVSAGLDYPGTGPRARPPARLGRAHYVAVTDADALAAFKRVAQLEGIIPALESSHALAWVMANPDGAADALDLVCLSGRGDKDLAEVIGHG